MTNEFVVRKTDFQQASASEGHEAAHEAKDALKTFGAAVKHATVATKHKLQQGAMAIRDKAAHIRDKAAHIRAEEELEKEYKDALGEKKEAPEVASKSHKKCDTTKRVKPHVRRASSHDDTKVPVALGAKATEPPRLAKRSIYESGELAGYGNPLALGNVAEQAAKKACEMFSIRE